MIDKKRRSRQDFSVVLSLYGWTTVAVPTIPSKGCAVCDKTGNVSSCAVSQRCQPNEICSVSMIISDQQLFYQLGCERKMTCDYSLQAYKESHSIIGRSDHGEIRICLACCDSWNCNKDNCIKLRKAQKCNDHSICGP